jgi:hypothetical protein
MTEQLFWLEHWEGKAKGGFFVRNDLKKFVEKLEASGYKLVGLKYDGTYNLECIVEEKDAKKV